GGAPRGGRGAPRGPAGGRGRGVGSSPGRGRPGGRLVCASSAARDPGSPPMLIAPREATPTAAAPMPRPVGRLRWVICGLLFVATCINYVDRFALSFLAKPLQTQFHWTDRDYGWILFAFQAAYATMNVPWGGSLDPPGTPPP